MHPETMKVIAAQRTDELRAVAREAKLLRHARTGRAAGSLPRVGPGFATAVRGRHTRRLRVLRRGTPARPQPA